MAKTKQTARKVDPQVRQEGMEQAVIVPPVQQEGEGEQGIAKVIEAGEQQAQQQVDTGKDPEDPTSPCQASKASISTALTPSTSTSTGTAEITAYMNKCQGFAKMWINEVVQKKEQAYRDLIDSLVGLAKEQDEIKELKVGVIGLSDEDIEAVLESIPDMSGKYIDTIGRGQVEVSKEEEEVRRKRFTESKKASEI